MNRDTAKNVTWIVALGALAVVLISGFFFVEKYVAQREEPREPLPTVAGFSRVYITTGEIPVREFANFLQDATGLSVVVSEELGARTVAVQVDISEATPEIVRALLEANGLRVDLVDLLDGQRVVRIEQVE